MPFFKSNERYESAGHALGSPVNGYTAKGISAEGANRLKTRSEKALYEPADRQKHRDNHQLTRLNTEVEQKKGKAS